VFDKISDRPSYETPLIVESLGLKDLEKITSNCLTRNDIRDLVRLNIFSEILYNDLSTKENAESVYIKKTDKLYETKIIKENILKLRSIVETERKEGNIIYSKLDEYIDKSDVLYERLTEVEIEILNDIILASKLANVNKIHS
jgi:hypothetical protein